MSTAAVLTLVASILSVSGPMVVVDVGSADGLQRGDWGMIFFEVVAADHSHTVEVGPAMVVTTSERQATLNIPSDLSVKSSHKVQFEIPRNRDTSPLIDTGGQPRSADVARRIAAVEATLEQSARVRATLLGETDQTPNLDPTSESIDELLERLTLVESELQPAVPGERAELREALRQRDRELDTTRRERDEAHARASQLEQQLSAAQSPTATKSSKGERSPRWKFWRRSKTKNRTPIDGDSTE